ncbi:MAG: DUF6261 family protein [Tannerella sp.]|jgi:uncharacterized protein (DUF2147 family)|nr:DUF6261 family protein [Tannerella sp.]
MNLRTVKHQSLLNGEHRSMNEEALSITKKYDPSKLGVESQYEALESALGIENIALGRIAKNPFTDPLHVADSGRDDTLRGMIRILTGNLRHPDPDVRQASEELLAIPQMNTETAARGHEEEEALINILLEHLAGDYKQQANDAGINAWVASLSAQNAEVARLQERAFAAAATAAATAGGLSVKEARRATDGAYDALVKRLDALMEISPGSYVAFAAEFNMMVKFYETAIKERAAHNRHKQKNLIYANLSTISDQTWTGDRLSPRIEVVYNGKMLAENTDFTVDYVRNTDVGTATVTVRGKGAYSGKKITTFNIVRN